MISLILPPTAIVSICSISPTTSKCTTLFYVSLSKDRISGAESARGVKLSRPLASQLGGCAVRVRHSAVCLTRLERAAGATARTSPGPVTLSSDIASCSFEPFPLGNRHKADDHPLPQRGGNTIQHRQGVSFIVGILQPTNG